MDDGGILRFLILICCAALLCAAIGVAVTADAEGHEFYAQDCCNDQDCAPAKDGDVVETSEGYFIKSLDITVPYNSDMIRHAPDGRFHLCILSDMIVKGSLICLYVPPRAY